MSTFLGKKYCETVANSVNYNIVSCQYIGKCIFHKMNVNDKHTTHAWGFVESAGAF